jgi:hypothetical protein
VAAEIIKLFQTGGTLILDEVDLILHPLKSELHWPLGRRVPLDFSTSRSGDGQGLTFVHFSAQPKPCLPQEYTLNTPSHPSTPTKLPPDSPSTHPLYHKRCLR